MKFLEISNWKFLGKFPGKFPLEISTFLYRKWKFPDGHFGIPNGHFSMGPGRTEMVPLTVGGCQGRVAGQWGAHTRLKPFRRAAVQHRVPVDCVP